MDPIQITFYVVVVVLLLVITAKAGSTSPGSSQLLRDIADNTAATLKAIQFQIEMARLWIGEALHGDGNEIAHIDLIIGYLNGAGGLALASTLPIQSQGHTTLLAVLEPNLAVRPWTITFTKVTLQNLDQATQMFGCGQEGVAKGVERAVREGIISADMADKMVIIVGVFIHPAARDADKIREFNAEAVYMAIRNAMKGSQNAATMLAKGGKSKHPYGNFQPKDNKAVEAAV